MILVQIFTKNATEAHKIKPMNFLSHIFSDAQKWENHNTTFWRIRK